MSQYSLWGFIKEKLAQQRYTNADELKQAGQMLSTKLRLKCLGERLTELGVESAYNMTILGHKRTQ